MATYLFKCRDCGTEYESPVGGDRMESCRSEGCSGVPRRVWAVNMARVPGGGREHRS